MRALRNVVTVTAGVAAAMVPVAPTGEPPDTAAPSVEDRLTLPAPTGPHPVGWEALHLVDRNRPDPWVPPAPRELMVSMWYPATAARGTRFVDPPAG